MTKKPDQLFYLVRHGETSWNKEARFQGSTETKLSNSGKNQASKDAAKLVAALESEDSSIPIQIVSSPLKRALQTADILRKSFIEANPKTVVVIKQDIRLRELTMGRWEGLSSQEVKQQFYEERKNRKRKPFHFHPIGGESMNQRLKEVSKAMNEVPTNSVIVTHSGILRILLHLLKGVPKQEAAKIQIPHIGIWHWDSAKLHTPNLDNEPD